MTVNPIIRKELVSVLRSRAALAMAVGFVAALSLLAVFMWPESGINPVGAMYSRLFFTVLLAGQMVMLALFSPPFSATSITLERETNTWEMLYYSLLRPRQILVGKLVGAVAFLLILVALSLPVGATCFLLGGVSPKEMFLAYLVLVMAGVSFGLIGLTCSAFCRSSFSALIATYVLLLAVCGGVHMPMLLLPEWKAGMATLLAVRSLSPFSALVAITQDAFRLMGEDASAGVVARYFAWWGILCAGMVVALLIRMAMRPGARPPKRRKVVDERTPLSVRVMRRMFFIIDPRRQRRSISPWMNPVFILDLRTRTAGIANLLRGVFACLILSIGLVLAVSGTWGATEPDTIRVIALSFQIGLIALIGPSLTIGAIASEIERRTFDSLRMTPLRPWTIFTGKFGAAAMFSVMLILAAVPIFFALRYIEQVNEPDALRAMFGQPRSLIAMFAVTCSTVVFALADGLFFSSVCRTTARAGAWAYGLMAIVTTASLLGWVFRERLSAGAASFVLAFNPIVTAIGAVSDSRFVEYGRWQNNAWALGTLSALLIAGTVYRLWRRAEPEE